MKKVIIWLLLLFSFQLNAQTDAYRHQLQLVDSVRSYIQNTLHLNIGNNFYTTWSTKKDSMYYYLYVSNAYQVESILPNTYQVYNVEDSAIAAAGRYSKQGYHTLVYRTAGTSNAELTPKLLSYSDEVITFIMLHEAVHRHINSFPFSKDYPYNYNESLCDAVANKACVDLSQNLKIILSDDSKALWQQYLFERAYSIINAQRQLRDSSSVKVQTSILAVTTSEIYRLVGSSINQFVKDRLLYAVTNAYFLRLEAYSLHYFELKKMLENGESINDIINSIYKREVQQEKQKR